MRNIRLITAAVALSLTAALATLVAPAVTPTAAAKSGPVCSVHHIPLHAKDGPNIYRGTFFYHWCVRSQPGHDAMWVKPTAALAGYHTLHLVRHWSYNCTFAGDMSKYVFRFYVYNPETGSNRHRTFSIDCDGSGNADTRGLTDFPRCYMPFIVDSDGRGGRAGHRPLCKLRVTVEGVRFGPDPNTHTVIAAHHKIHPALYGSN